MKTVSVELYSVKNIKKAQHRSLYYWSPACAYCETSKLTKYPLCKRSDFTTTVNDYYQPLHDIRNTTFNYEFGREPTATLVSHYHCLENADSGRKL